MLQLAHAFERATLTGKRRWMRLTGAVESRDGVAYRIFGMKQDITEEKLMADQTRYLAEFDVMTGLDKTDTPGEPRFRSSKYRCGLRATSQQPSALLTRPIAA